MSIHTVNRLTDKYIYQLAMLLLPFNGMHGQTAERVKQLFAFCFPASQLIVGVTSFPIWGVGLARLAMIATCTFISQWQQLLLLTGCREAVSVLA